MNHCGGCSGWYTEHKQSGDGLLFTTSVVSHPCPGVECEACKGKDAEIARLKNELATTLDNCRTWRELYEKYNRLHCQECVETDHLRALVDVGREMAEVLRRNGNCTFERMSELSEQWRALEGWK